MTRPARPAQGPAAPVTLGDVARLAGVSVATVSRTINQPAMVATDKRVAVQGALSALGYIPNHAARALLSRRSMTIGLIVPTIENPLFAPVIERIEARLEQAGYAILLACSRRRPERELKQVLVMIERGVDGLILTGGPPGPELLSLLQPRGLATVLQDATEAAPGMSAVGMPNEAALALAIDELVRHGHRRIAILTGPMADTPPVARRTAGAVARLADHGLQPAAIIETSSYRGEASREGSRRLLALDPRPTAVAATGDILVLGLMAEARAQGLRVPADLSIIGCGDTAMAQFADPPLSTIHLPYPEMGDAAARQLLDLVDGGDGQALRVMPCHLVDRGSVMTLPNLARSRLS